MFRRLFKKPKNRRVAERESLLDVKLRTSQTRASQMRKVGIGFSATFILLAIGLIVWRGGLWLLDRLVYKNDAFAIQNIEVQTDGFLRADTIRKWAMVRPGQNLMALDLMSVKRDLELQPPIEFVAVERILPHTLKLNVSERDPIAQTLVTIGHNGGTLTQAVYDFDEGGFVMKPLDSAWRTAQPPADDRLPILVGVQAGDVQLGRPTESPQIQAALRLVEEFNHSQMVGLVELQRISISEPEVLQVITSQGAEITFSLNHFDTQFHRWRIIYDQYQKWGKAIVSLDLSIANNLPVKWVAASTVAPLPAHPAKFPQQKGNMFDSASVIVGLEIGTSKICVVVGEINSAKALNIIGLGQARSRGVRKGEIADAALAQEDVRNAIVEAEQMANVEIRSVYLGVTGNHIRGFNNHGVHPVPSADREITQEDVQDVMKNAKAINLPADNTVIHAIRQHFHVDEQSGILNPVGMYGARVEVDMHVVHGLVDRLKNGIAVVKGLQLDVDEIVFTGLASALALLSNEQKELGSLVIDMGGGTTEYVVYSEGIIKHTGVLAVGGDHVSNDLAYGLKIPLGRAEQLKLEHGAAVLDSTCKGQTISTQGQLGLPAKSLNLEHLRRIMSLRLEETFQLIETELANSGMLDHLRAGVFVCGGGARIPGIQTLAGNIFQLPAFPGKTNSISGLKSALDQPEFATAIGLVKFGSLQTKAKPSGGFTDGIMKTFAELFSRR